MAPDHERAQRFAEQWYAAWNSHDLAVILHFEPLDLFVGVNTVLLRYRSVGGNLAAEVVSAAGSRFWRFESNAEG